MSLFESQIAQLRQSLSGRAPDVCLETASENARRWPRSAAKQMILEQDTGTELGNGSLPSFAAILWTETPGLVTDGAVRVYGQDIPQIAGSDGAKSRPFGKAVLLETDTIPANELFAAFEKMDAVRFDMNLDGYMLRGFTQRNREWSRVSAGACRSGFSFLTLGSELIRDYKALPFVKGAELLFFTENALIRTLAPLMETCAKIAGALNTMFENISMDCKNCDAHAICEDFDELRRLHRRLAPE